MSELPLTKLLFLPDGSLVGAGHSYDPVLFARTAGGWALGKLQGQKAAVAAKGNFANARNMFQAQSTQGQSGSADSSVSSIHQNLVCGLQLFNHSFAGTAAEFTTSALDGKIVFWTRDEISAAMSALAIQ